MNSNKFACQIDSCNRLSHAKGYCKNHYMKFKKYGDATKVVCYTTYGEPVKWLEAHRNFNSNECLIWPYSKDKKGYGQIYINGERLAPHRIMCEVLNGAPFPKATAAHNCGNGGLGCVNPKHLRWATQKNNQHDKYAHGTSGSKLSLDQVKQIRSLHGWLAISKLAAEYEVSYSVIYKIVNNLSWNVENAK